MFRSLALLTVCSLCAIFLCSCVTEEEKEKMRDDLSSAMAANSSSSDSSDSVSESESESEAESEKSNDIDHELSVPDDWKDYTGGGSNPDKYPWEDDENIPKLEWGIEEKPYDIEGEGTTGERGNTWEMPEWDGPTDSFAPDEDINMPPMP